MQFSPINTFPVAEGSEPGLVKQRVWVRIPEGAPFFFFFFILLYTISGIWTFTHAVQSTFTKQCGRRADAAPAILFGNLR